MGNLPGDTHMAPLSRIRCLHQLEAFRTIMWSVSSSLSWFLFLPLLLAHMADRFNFKSLPTHLPSHLMMTAAATLQTTN